MRDRLASILIYFAFGIGLLVCAEGFFLVLVASFAQANVCKSHICFQVHCGCGRLFGFCLSFWLLFHLGKIASFFWLVFFYAWLWSMSLAFVNAWHWFFFRFLRLAAGLTSFGKEAKL